MNQISSCLHEPLSGSGYFGNPTNALPSPTFAFTFDRRPQRYRGPFELGKPLR